MENYNPSVVRLTKCFSAIFRPFLQDSRHRASSGGLHVQRTSPSRGASHKATGMEVSRDQADNFLLAMARLGEADFLITGDKRDLLSLRAFRRTKIVTASRMLEHLGGKPPRKECQGSRAAAAETADQMRAMRDGLRPPAR
jgi:hypothetical protein